MRKIVQKNSTDRNAPPFRPPSLREGGDMRASAGSKSRSTHILNIILSK